MALSTCVKCGRSGFELREATPSGSAFIHYFLQCSSCGGVVGMTEYNNVGALLEKQARQIAELQQAVEQISHTVARIAQQMR